MQLPAQEWSSAKPRHRLGFPVVIAGAEVIPEEFMSCLFYMLCDYVNVSRNRANPRAACLLHISPQLCATCLKHPKRQTKALGRLTLPNTKPIACRAPPPFYRRAQPAETLRQAPRASKCCHRHLHILNTEPLKPGFPPFVLLRSSSN